jgi:hypothetical protein
MFILKNISIGMHIYTEKVCKAANLFFDLSYYNSSQNCLSKIMIQASL